MADIVERYPAGSTTANYTGNNLTDVQTYSGAATGDVIKVSQNITVSTTIGNGATSGYSVGSFTLQGASSENPVTISGGTRLYNLPNTVTSFTLKDVTISGFKNTEQYGGAFLTNGVTTVYAENVTFSNNKSYRGGVFGSNNSKLTLYGNNIVFDSNQVAGHPQNNDFGGAIRGDIAIYGETSESVIKFINNSATNCGGAITSGGSEGIISSGQFIFDNNNSNSSGGAIHAAQSLTFSGIGSSMTFTNNVAAQNGNDIYLQSQSQTTILTFKDAGNYSFDGGIYLENANQKTIIDEAQVTIAGRKNDTTNNYVLRSVTISNGGKLTANLEYIDSLTGTFNLGTSDSAGTLELNVNAGAKTFNNVISGTGTLTKTGAGTLTLSQVPQYTGSTTVETGTLELPGGSTLYNLSGGSESNPATLTVTGDLSLSNDDESTFIGSITAQKITVNTANDVALKLYAGANNKVTADSLTVSSGELDFKGYFAGNIEVFNGSVFSPGNSVGTADITGNITFAGATADSNGVALFEFGEYADGAEAGVDYDLFIMENGGIFTADDGVILLDFAYNDENSWATVGNEFQLVSGGGFEDNVDYNPWLGNMTDLFKLEGRSADGLYLVGIKAAPEPGSGVPEPSTWALLILGSVGLLYVRKRTRK